MSNIAPVATISSQPKLVGSEILVNSATIGIQWMEQITTLANGNFVVTWQDGGPRADLTTSPFPGSLGVGGATGDTSGGAIKAQMFTAGGSPIGGEFLVNTAVQSDQSSQAITALSNGGFVVTWTDFSQDLGDVGKIAIKAQVYGADGARVGTEIMVNTSTDDGHLRTGSQVTGLADGGFVVTWAAIGVDVFAQKFSAAGTPVGSEILVGGPNSGPAFEPPPQVIALDNGGFVVAWAGNGGAITQVYDTAGAAVGGVTTDAGFREVQTAALDIGGFVKLDAVSGAQMTAQVFSDAGVAAGAPIAIQATTALAGFGPQIAALPHGHFVVTWEAQQSNTIVAIDAQVFDADGTAITGPFGVSTTPLSPSDNRALSEKITALSNGDFVITWNDLPLSGNSTNFDIEARVFTADGTPLGDQFTASTSTGHSHLDPQIVAQPNGGFVVTWTDELPGTLGAQGDDSLTAIKAQVFNLGYVATEGVALNLKNNGLSVSDADGNGLETVTLSVSEGILNVSPGNTGVFQASGSGTGSVTLIGATSTLNALLGFDPSTISSVSFIDTSDAPASHVTLTLTIDDNAGGTSTASTTIQILPVNDPPVNTAPELVVAAQNTDAAVAGLSVSDPDSPSMTTTLHVNHGTLRVAATGGATVSGSGTSDVTLTGSVAQIDAALSAANGVIYHGASSFSGVDHLVMTSNDGASFAVGGPLTATSTTLISVTAAPADDTPPSTPAAPVLVHDTGTSNSDGLTSDPAISYPVALLGDALLYKLDSGSFTTTVPTFATNGAADGQHTVTIEERDTAGNISGTSSLAFTLDTTAPNTPAAPMLAHDTGIAGDKITSDPSISYPVALLGDALLYKLDSGSFTTTVPTFATNGAADGQHTVTIEERDTAGNISGTSSLAFTLDTTAPNTPAAPMLAHDTGIAGDKITSDPSISYPAAAGDVLLYKLDGGGFSTTVPVIPTDGTAEGSHTVSIEERDAAGNVSAASSLTFNFDVLAHPSSDFNADGHSDILLQNASTGDVFTWEMNSTSLVGIGAVGLTPGAAWQVKDEGDYNGDGHADVLLQKIDTGDVFLWELNGTSLAGGGAAGWTPGAAWHATNGGDFNGDGKSDILLQNADTGDVYIWEMNGTSLAGSGAAGWTPGAAWQVKGTGDFNGDGKSDIVLQNANTGDVYIWEMNGTSLVGSGAVGWTPGAAWQVKATGDYNGDGKSDILLQNANTGDVYIWELNGTSLVGNGPAGWTPGGAWHAANGGDFNGDGKSDILLQNANTGDAYMWLMNGTSMIASGSVGWTPGADWHIS